MMTLSPQFCCVPSNIKAAHDDSAVRWGCDVDEYKLWSVGENLLAETYWCTKDLANAFSTSTRNAVFLRGV